MSELDHSVALFVAAIRKTVQPVAHLTDDELRACGMDPPVIRLLLGLRDSLRIYDATRPDEIGEVVERDGEVVAVATDRRKP